VHKCKFKRKILSRDIFSKENFSVKICTECGHGSTVVKKNVNLRVYYPELIYSTNEKAKFSWPMSCIYKYFRVSRAKYILSKEFKNRFLLDIGCGDGSFIKKLQEHGIKAYGTELTKESAAVAIKKVGLKKILIGYNNKANIYKNKFNAITMWHTLEHFPNPEKILRFVNNCLSDDGTLYIEVPNFGSLQSSIDKNYWIYNDVPRHINHFTKESLKNLLINSGFKITKLKTSSLEFGIVGMLSSLDNFIRKDYHSKNFIIKRLFHLEAKSFVQNLFHLIVLVFLFIPAVAAESISILGKNGSVIMLEAKKKN
jgi:2-polyprenyl-3-methyl-5-hydroxy-6-metoxy-1,4-benzoquinol methylase